jgi:hypothetical protein
LSRHVYLIVNVWGGLTLAKHGSHTLALQLFLEEALTLGLQEILKYEEYEVVPVAPPVLIELVPERQMPTTERADS